MASIAASAVWRWRVGGIFPSYEAFGVVLNGMYVVDLELGDRGHYMYSNQPPGGLNFFRTTTSDLTHILI
jgi:hypothetical protein